MRNYAESRCLHAEVRSAWHRDPRASGRAAIHNAGGRAVPDRQLGPLLDCSTLTLLALNDVDRAVPLRGRSRYTPAAIDVTSSPYLSPLTHIPRTPSAEQAIVSRVRVNHLSKC